MRQQQYFLPLIFFPLLLSLFFWGCSENPLTFMVRFPDASGLKQADHVYFGKNEIGTVKTVSYSNRGDYLVEVKISQEFKNAATEDSRFYIEQSPTNKSAMAVIVEQERPGGMVLQNGTTVQGTSRKGYLNEFFKDLSTRAEQAESELNKALGDLGKSLDATSEKLNKNLEETLKDLSSRLDSFKNEFRKPPEDQEIHQLEESLRQFGTEFQQAKKDVQDHIRYEMFPRLRKEMEQLHEQLKKEGREKELEKVDKQAKELEII